MDFLWGGVVQDFFHHFIHEGGWLDFLLALGIFLLFLLVRKWFAGLIIKLLNLAQKVRTEIGEEIIAAFKKPLEHLFVALGFFLAISYLYLPAEVENWVYLILRAYVVYMVAWGGYNLLDSESFLFRGLAEKMGLATDQILIPFLSKFARVILVALAVSVVAEEMGYNVNQFIAGLGIGGLALALAAQQTLSNIFAGFMIIIDKYFSVGDWIYSPSVEGVVEEVNFRTTKVRTFAKSLVTVPNAQLTSEAVTNWSKMPKRRVVFHLGVTYTTPREKLQQCVNDIRGMLENHPEVHKEKIMVFFEQFNDSSLDIFIYYFTVQTDWEEHLRVKEDVNFKIMELLENRGVSVAFPSRSIYFENQLGGNIAAHWEAQGNTGETGSGHSPFQEE